MPDESDPFILAHLIESNAKDLAANLEAALHDRRRLLNLARRVAAGEQCCQADAIRLLHDLEGTPTERPEFVGAEF